MLDRIILREESDTCYEFGHGRLDDLGVRISSVFVIFAVSAIGAFFPLLSRRCKKFQLPGWVFFATRYFGSGVILATGFIHLLADGLEALTDECIGGTFENYPWAEGIALMSLFCVFAFDALAHKRIHDQSKMDQNNVNDSVLFHGCCDIPSSLQSSNKKSPDIVIGTEESTTLDSNYEISKERMLNCIILECGIVLHSIFIGLSLAISNSEFVTLYIALCFHQFFEGLGLGTRFADVVWPRKYTYLPWIMAFTFSLSTPLATAVGLGVRDSFAIGSRRGLITSGIFDAACAGILIYNSIAELMGFDFIYSDEFKEKDMRSLVMGIFVLGLGALAMAVIGNWT
ncbi:Zinc-regulated transporter 1 [Candida viswanathii]|uniref:Zinc-regulated transporter 1 n=1 Tax=Candida viswanathii TaxID=5486 RepID=A0A367YQV4_9ASCO|nr:Zinc-regulated transporter 1 [Candida viswanathii]